MTTREPTKDPEVMRAVVHCRVSDPSQVENLRLETQGRDCCEYCESQGFEVDRRSLGYATHCTSCGSPFELGANFCRFCGTAV